MVNWHPIRVNPAKHPCRPSHLDDARLGWVPAEYFTGLGVATSKKRSPFPHTVEVFELANDWIGYLPDREVPDPAGRLSDLDGPSKIRREGYRRARSRTKEPSMLGVSSKEAGWLAVESTKSYCAIRRCKMPKSITPCFRVRRQAEEAINFYIVRFSRIPELLPSAAMVVALGRAGALVVSCRQMGGTRADDRGISYG